MTTLDVLLIEGHPGEGAADVAVLEAAGHRIHRCWDPPAAPGAAERIPLRDRYLCTGVTRGSCPLEGGIDVALLVRGSAQSQPTTGETAVTCSLRAGVPIVENGPALLDPFAPWVEARSDSDVVAACEGAARRAFDPLRAEIAARVQRLLVTAELDPDDITAVIEFDSPRLVVRLRGPAVDTQLEQALCVRALEAVRVCGRTFARVDVAYEVNQS